MSELRVLDEIVEAGTKTMILRLEVTGAKAETLRDERRKTFHEAGGAIGRSADVFAVSWILPDPQVSARHALITFVNGVFYIEDRSRNGIFIGSFNNRLKFGQPRAINHGDTIIIDPYTIQATVESGPEAVTPEAEVPFAGPFASESGPWKTPPPLTGRPLVPDDASRSELDPLKVLNYGPRPVLAPSEVEGLKEDSPLYQHYQPPKPKTPSAQPAPPIPDDWDKSSAMWPVLPAAVPGPRTPTTPPEANSSAAVRQPERDRIPAAQRDPAGARKVFGPARNRPASAAAPNGDGQDVGLASVLAGAGLKNVPVTADLARNLGQILRVVVTGVMDVLQARQQAKDEFRMGMTTFKAADNNPLKFSATVDDALYTLLVKRSAAYLGPVDAFEDAFDDVRNHQVAMLAGLRVAFDAMVAEFDPDRLQADFDRQLKKGAMVSLPAKLRYWELYRAKIHDMVRDAETCYRDLFGDEFSRAYEEQLKRLKARGRAPKR